MSDNLPGNILRQSLFIFLLIIQLNTTYAQSRKYDPGKKFHKEELQKDFIFLRKALEEGHPTLYWYTSKENLDSAFDETFQRINKDMTEREFYKVLTPLIEYIKCGHTNLKVSRGYQKYLNKEARFFPLATWIAEENYQPVIRYNYSNDSILKAGYELLTINNIPAADISRKFVSYTPTDGYIETAKFRYAERKFSTYIHYYIGEPETFRIKALNKDKDTLAVSLPPLTRTEIIKINKERAKHREKQQEQKPEREKPGKVYTLRNNDFRIIENDSIKAGLLRIRGFEGLCFGRLYRRSFRALKNEDVDHLIIDLRENPGGYSANSIKLMRFLNQNEFDYYSSVTMKDRRFSFSHQLTDNLAVLFYTTFLTRRRSDERYDVIAIRGTNKVKPRKRLNFDKEVYILTTGLTSSAASLFTANMHYQKRATFVGEETGGGYEGCAGGIIPDLILPNTKLRVNFPIMQFKTAVKTDIVGRGTFPDHEVKINFQDFARGKDNQLNYVLKLISEKKKMSGN